MSKKNLQPREVKRIFSLPSRCDTSFPRSTPLTICDNAMSSGNGVSDLILLSKLVNAARKQFVDAPGQFKEIRDEWVLPAGNNRWKLIVRFNSVKVLTNVLRDIDDVMAQRDLSSQQKKDLGEIARGCHDVLNQLKEKLDKNQVNSNVKGIGGKPKRVWTGFQWDQAEIDQFRNRISLNITAFGTFVGRITRCYLLSLCGRKARCLPIPEMRLPHHRVV